MSLTTLAASMKADIEELLVRGHNIADEYGPELTAIAERVENDPLIQAAESAVLPPEAKQLVADLILKLAAIYPQPAPAPAPADAPLEVAAEAEAEHQAA